MAFFKKRRSAAEAAPELSQETSPEQTESQELQEAAETGQAHESAENTSTIEEENNNQEAGSTEEKKWAKPQTTLVIPDTFKENLSNEMRYVMQFSYSELPQLEQGELSIDGYRIEQGPFALTLTAFLRNNKEEEVILTQVPLVLVDANYNAVARKVFNLQALEIQPGTGIPYRFDFYPEHLITPSADLSSWYVGFHMQSGQIKPTTDTLSFEVRENSSMLQDKIEQEDRRVYADLQRVLEQTEGQVNFIGARVSVSDEGELAVEILVRNGQDEEIHFADQIVFELRDARGDVVASKPFDLSDLHIPPHTVARYTLEYGKNAFLKEEPDFSDWSITLV
ncbi:SLAP domain-containing protein [Aneurinibacillus terranovensis]|uniref:SLAP domain-containing protein n=1 Tax=Aneurinibacillus terranovensis TaxID=278991 RepID=UPI00040EAA6B|nr:SLAP domain-containing protein [Aneurinibacillus terranovensis]